MNTIAEKIVNKRKGTFVRIKYEVDVKPSASNASHTIKKRVETTVRVGVAYSNLKSVKERQSESTPSTRAPWWKWKDGYLNIVKESLKNPSQEYLHFTTVHKGANSRTEYFIDGKEATIDDVMELTIPSYWNKNTTDVFDVKVENMLWVS